MVIVGVFIGDEKGQRNCVYFGSEIMPCYSRTLVNFFMFVPSLKCVFVDLTTIARFVKVDYNTVSGYLPKVSTKEFYYTYLHDVPVRYDFGKAFGYFRTGRS